MMSAETDQATTASLPADSVLAAGVRSLILLEIAAVIVLTAAGPKLGPLATIAILTIPVLYLAVVVIRTHDPLDGKRPMHPRDVSLVRSSGPLAFLTLVLMAVAVIPLHLIGGEGAERTVLQPALVRAVMGIVIACAELGALFAFVCLSTPDDFGHVAPALLWKGACAPLLLVLGYVVVLIVKSPDVLPRPSITASRQTHEARSSAGPARPFVSRPANASAPAP